MGRPLQFDKEQALNKALEIFWRKGYESASLLDLIEAMDLSKSSFYQSFTSKQDLFVRCLNEYQARLSKNLTEKLNSASSGYEFIEQTLVEIITEPDEEIRRKGCFLMNTATISCSLDNSFLSVTENGFAQLEKVFQTAVERAQTEGGISPDKNAQHLANLIVCTIAGLRTMIKAGTNQQTLRSIITTTLSMLK
jgi:TetR/AcrR family transcriptional regulator, transcriptional repressor for nem operon